MTEKWPEKQEIQTGEEETKAYDPDDDDDPKTTAPNNGTQNYRG